MSSHLCVLIVTIRPANRSCVFIYTHNCAFSTESLIHSKYLIHSNQIGWVGSCGYKIESLFKRSMGELVFKRKAWDPRRVWNELEGRGVAQSDRWRPQECLMPSGDKDRQKLSGMNFPLRYALSKSLRACVQQVCHLRPELFPPTTSHCLKAESTSGTGLERCWD